MTWLVPENKLDVQQRSFIDTSNIDSNNIWIKGFAGSGKSILLAYTAKKILSRNKNARVVLIVFTHSLKEMFQEALHEIGLNVPVMTFYYFMRENSYYDYILCDEVQDLVPSVISEMKKRSSHIIVAGDPYQSIYKADPRWHEETVKPSEIVSLIQGTSFELNIIHRLSKSIIDAVQNFMPDMNIFAAKRDMTKSDTQIRLCHASSAAQEVKYILDEAGEAVNQGYTAAVLFPTAAKALEFADLAAQNKNLPKWERQNNRFDKPDFGSLNNYFSSNALKLKYVGNGYGSLDEKDHKVVLMTFHSAKGLDFENVFIPFANNYMFINRDEELAKTLFMVAMTRAIDNLYITYSGRRSYYLNSFDRDCINIEISENSNKTRNAANAAAETNDDNETSIWGF